MTETGSIVIFNKTTVLFKINIIVLLCSIVGTNLYIYEMTSILYASLNTNSLISSSFTQHKQSLKTK